VFVVALVTSKYCPSRPAASLAQSPGSPERNTISPFANPCGVDVVTTPGLALVIVEIILVKGYGAEVPIAKRYWCYTRRNCRHFFSL